jgi:hypothetical protein
MQFHLKFCCPILEKCSLYFDKKANFDQFLTAFFKFVLWFWQFYLPHDNRGNYFSKKLKIRVRIQKHQRRAKKKDIQAS